ncbi:hypothetical protein [Duganella vulcania]|uniref:Phosphoribosylanthranilate isomerase n=1 Tax=Duganella vulcania TaxID=2692166 RepID=A0A845GET6_9BURK|nr:hypothetical protein [Duganella vulcania]MYM92421.1 hypothetical protein [Duganella vulcania]
MHTAKPNRITLTGADEKTSIADLVALCKYYPELEVGLLYTAKPEGRHRYPSLEWLHAAASALTGRCAIHICGGVARASLRGGLLTHVTRHAPRVQINGLVTAPELELLARCAQTVITQHCEINMALVHVPIANHQLLVDGSAGRGISPAVWGKPATRKEVGFAGGLGPANIVDEVSRIAQVAHGAWWIDMEAKLRVDDWFSIDAAREVLVALLGPLPVAA